MVAKEFIDDLEPVLLERTNGLQGFDDRDHDHREEEEETLSLCDLAVSSNVEDYYWSEFSCKDDQDEDFFEFSSEDFTASTYPKPNQNIIFCGKLISYKGEEVVHDHDHDQTQNQNSTLKQQNPDKSRVLAWKSKKERHEQGKSCDFKYDFSVKKVSSSSSSISRSRWYLLAFGSFGKGITGFSTRMELRDIRSRQQSRRRVATPTMFRPDGGGGDMVKRGKNNGLWRLLSIFGCKSQRTNAVVKAPFSCIPYL